MPVHVSTAFHAERLNARAQGPTASASGEIPAPRTFSDHLNEQIRLSGETSKSLHQGLAREGVVFAFSALRSWLNGQKLPRTEKSFYVLAHIEKRYQLREGYFRGKLPREFRLSLGGTLERMSRTKRQQISWHLPDDFRTRSPEQQAEILEWVRTSLFAGGTDYRRYLGSVRSQHYGFRFQHVEEVRIRRNKTSQTTLPTRWSQSETCETLSDEMADFIRFKTAPFVEVGFQRRGIWSKYTITQRLTHFGLMFGALRAAPNGSPKGLGLPDDQLTFGLLLFPAVWDWYLRWREQRRGFYTCWERSMLEMLISMTRAETGWLRQRPDLSVRLRPVAGLVGPAEIAKVQKDWGGACDAVLRYAKSRRRDIARLARIHRDPFEAILPVLEAASPVGEYLKICDEIEQDLPFIERHPMNIAEAVRSILMIRLGLHLGVRQKNLRELTFCAPGGTQRSELQLSLEKAGELRWSASDSSWDVYIPLTAFKNHRSSYFLGKPLRIRLPNHRGLYGYIESYLSTHRPCLLGKARDPGTFFVMRAKPNCTSAAFSESKFYSAWRLIIERYGVYNPYTQRGATPGVLPHGPHSVRTVLATHVLKQTGSFELASYAIQNTPKMVETYYGRFLPQDKAGLAAKVLEDVWTRSSSA